MDIETEVKGLRKQVLVEVIRRCSMELQAMKAMQAYQEMRQPYVEQEMYLAKTKLAELTKEDSNGPSGN